MLLLLANLAVLPGTKDSWVAFIPVHRGGPGSLPLPVLRQTVALHHLGPAPISARAEIGAVIYT